jgi:hypothetical protein
VWFAVFIHTINIVSTSSSITAALASSPRHMCYTAAASPGIDTAILSSLSYAGAGWVHVGASMHKQCHTYRLRHASQQQHSPKALQSLLLHQNMTRSLPLTSTTPPCPLHLSVPWYAACQRPIPPHFPKHLTHAITKPITITTQHKIPTNQHLLRCQVAAGRALAGHPQ